MCLGTIGKCLIWDTFGKQTAVCLSSLIASAGVESFFWGPHMIRCFGTKFSSLLPVEMRQMRSGSSVLKCKPSKCKPCMFEALYRHRCDGSDVLGAWVIFVFFPICPCFNFLIIDFYNGC